MIIPLITRAPLTAASNSYIVKVGGQSTILSPGSNTHLQQNISGNEKKNMFGSKKSKLNTHKRGIDDSVLTA